MTATPPPQWPSAPPTSWGAGRIVALVIGLLLLMPALGLLAGGGALLWADTANRSDGFVFSETDDVSTGGYALVSERIELAEADWLPFSAALGTARAELASAQGSDVFAGIAPAAEVAAYLDGVEHSIIDDLGTGADDEVTVTGGAPSGPPTDQDFWSAEVSGSGIQRLDWEPAQGDWVFVVMNADGSAGVSVDARIGATVPALGGLAWSLLGVGLFLLVIAVLLLVLAIRRPAPRPYPGPPYPASPAMGAQPTWTPPAPADRTTAADARPDSARTGPPPPTPPATG